MPEKTGACGHLRDIVLTLYAQQGDAGLQCTCCDAKDGLIFRCEKCAGPHVDGLALLAEIRAEPSPIDEYGMLDEAETAEMNAEARDVLEYQAEDFGPMTPEQRERWEAAKGKAVDAASFERVMEALLQLYPDGRQARRWLHEHHRLMGGKTPAAMLAEGRTDEVLAVIDQLRTGGYA